MVQSPGLLLGPDSCHLGIPSIPARWTAQGLRGWAPTPGQPQEGRHGDLVLGVRRTPAWNTWDRANRAVSSSAQAAASPGCACAIAARLPPFLAMVELALVR